MLEIREGYFCFPREVVGVYAGLAFVDCILAVLAFFQLIRIHLRNSQLGWTRQKVFHLLIGSSNTGYFIFFFFSIVAICKGWLFWSHSCGFIFMALPKILSFAAFLLLLSFWVDLRCQADDEDCEDEDSSFHEALLEITLDHPTAAHTDNPRLCLPFRSSCIGSRQKMVIWVTAAVFALMMAFAVLMWIGMGHNFIDSSLLATVYVDVFAIASLSLGGAMACYGLLICTKMRSVRSEGASEIWKVAGLAIVSFICFTASAFVALFTQIPVLYYCQKLDKSGLDASVLLALYYFIGSSVPSAFVLGIMRELPPPVVANLRVASRTIAYIADSSTVVHNRQRWISAASLQNQISRGSPI